MAYRAFEPVICVVVFLLVAVGYHSCITASIAGRIASIIKDVCCDVLFISANRALIPVIYFVIFLLIAVGYRSCIATKITSRIAGIIKDVRCYILLFMTY